MGERSGGNEIFAGVSHGMGKLFRYPVSIQGLA